MERKVASMRKILFLDASGYSLLKANFGEQAIRNFCLERDEFGFFKHVYHVTFPSPKSQVIKLNSRHTVIEISKDKFTVLRKVKVVFNLLNIVNFLFEIRALIKKEGIDIIRAIDAREQAVLDYLLSILAGIPWCISVHSDYEKRRSLDNTTFALFGSFKIARIIEHFTFSRAPLVMVIRDSLRNKAIKAGARANLVRVTPHGVDFNLLSKESDRDGFDKNKYNIGQDRRIVSFAARITEENYVYDLVEIAKATKKVRNDVVFLIAGGGKDRKNIEEIIKTEGLLDNVKFLGFIPRETVFALRKASDVNLCLMGGFSLLEATASGRPVISYDVEWHSEVIVNGQTGFLVQENDIQAITDKLNYLLNNPKTCEIMGQNAKQRVLNKYSLEKMSIEKIKCYKEILECVS